MSFRLVLVMLLAFGSLGLVLWGVTAFWQGLGAGLSLHGWFAYILGGVLTLALSAGLFLLSFHSARHGYDDVGPPPD